MRSGYFETGKQVGEWTTYDTKGKIVKVAKMKSPRLPLICLGCRTGKKHREAEFTADLDLRTFERRSNGAGRSLQATRHCWPVCKMRDAAVGSDSSFAICASYSTARSSSLFWVKESACFARRRQRSDCSFKVVKSIDH